MSLSTHVTSNASSRKRIKEKISLDENEIHLWVTNPNDISSVDPEDKTLLNEYATLLSPDEVIKQQRYKFAKDRHDALITRVFTRDLLSYYADVSPKEWQFEKGDKGKPEVANSPIPLRFNISHTKNLIVCAVTLTNDIGCDVENTKRNNRVLNIAKRYFSSNETKELFSLPEELQHSRFFDYWTLKEAYIKAWGLGLAIPLADFSFNISDSIRNHNNIFSIKENITLTFAEHREDNSDVWRNWLLYPSTQLDKNQEHRIALSVRAKGSNQKIDYKLRFFNSLPLQGYSEL